MKNLFAALALASLTACVSVPMDITTAPTVPAERVLEQSFVQPSAGKVQVRVSIDSLRDVLFKHLSLFIDGTHVAEMDSGEIILLYVEPGSHTVEVGDKDSTSFRFTQRDHMTKGLYGYRFVFDGSRHALIHDTR